MRPVQGRLRPMALRSISVSGPANQACETRFDLSVCPHAEHVREVWRRRAGTAAPNGEAPGGA